MVKRIQHSLTRCGLCLASCSFAGAMAGPLSSMAYPPASTASTIASRRGRHHHRHDSVDRQLVRCHGQTVHSICQPPPRAAISAMFVPRPPVLAVTPPPSLLRRLRRMMRHLTRLPPPVQEGLRHPPSRSPPTFPAPRRAYFLRAVRTSGSTDVPGPGPARSARGDGLSPTVWAPPVGGQPAARETAVSGPPLL